MASLPDPRPTRSPCIVCWRRAREPHSRQLATGPCRPLKVLRRWRTASAAQQALRADRTALAPAINPCSGQNCPEALIRARSETLMASAALCSMLPGGAEGPSLAIPALLLWAESLVQQAASWCCTRADALPKLATHFGSCIVPAT